jgi:hypothetical protein
VASHPTLMHAELTKMYGCLFKPELITRNEAVGKLNLPVIQSPRFFLRSFSHDRKSKCCSSAQSHR